ncbi:unnamed protein product [Arabis nemorensis]|uniref:Uncharacterized protein n=1 Tax=Arabis nemorensis TaxID=586526 RepID=A0A565B8Y4_9BRAS|nr:unnamed protein product [Arabis nemorensis]
MTRSRTKQLRKRFNLAVEAIINTMEPQDLIGLEPMPNIIPHCPEEDLIEGYTRLTISQSSQLQAPGEHKLGEPELCNTRHIDQMEQLLEENNKGMERTQDEDQAASEGSQETSCTQEHSQNELRSEASQHISALPHMHQAPTMASSSSNNQRSRPSVWIHVRLSFCAVSKINHNSVVHFFPPSTSSN